MLKSDEESNLLKKHIYNDLQYLECTSISHTKPTKRV